MIKSIVVILITGVTSFIYTDLDNENTFFSLFLPFVVFLSLVALALWFVALFHKLRIPQTAESHNYDSAGEFGGFEGGGGDSGNG